MNTLGLHCAGKISEVGAASGWTAGPVIGEIVTSSSLLEKDRQ
ncbi:hypothetical protein ACWELJ_33785 [Nocardia sp. NPDC004582]